MAMFLDFGQTSSFLTRTGGGLGEEGESEIRTLLVILGAFFLRLTCVAAELLGGGAELMRTICTFSYKQRAKTAALSSEVGAAVVMRGVVLFFASQDTSLISLFPSEVNNMRPYLVPRSLMPWLPSVPFAFFPLSVLTVSCGNGQAAGQPCMTCE